jgi:hypothetical protein
MVVLHITSKESEPAGVMRKFTKDGAGAEDNLEVSTFDDKEYFTKPPEPDLTILMIAVSSFFIFADTYSAFPEEEVDELIREPLEL